MISGSVTKRNAPNADAPEVAGRLLQVRVHAGRAGPDDDRHVRDAERDVRDRQLAERAVRVEQLQEEQQQAQPHDDLGRHHRQEQQRLGRGAAAEPQPGQPEAEQRAEDRRHDDRDERDPERDRTARSSSSSLPNSVGYQSSVKPCHTMFRFESLKLKMIRTTIGANRNA